MEFVNTVLDSIGAIASGAIGGAAAAIEGVLKRILPLVIGFLASLLGLGGISEKIKSILEAIQRPVGKVIDSIISKVVKFGKKIWGKLKGAVSKRRGGKLPDARTEVQKKAAVDQALRESEELMGRADATAGTVAKALPAIKKRHQLTVLQIMQEGPDAYKVHAELNPRGDTKTKAESGTWRLAPGGFVAHEDNLFRDAEGNPLRGSRGEIKVHLLRKHVNLSPTDVAARVAVKRTVASGFSDIAVMEKAVMDCLKQRATEINDALSPGGKPSPNGTSLAVTQSLSYRCGYGYSLRFRQSRAGKEDPEKYFRSVEIAENELRSVTVVVRVSNSTKREFKVETAWPIPRGG
jgi:hypothetical protein